MLIIPAERRLDWRHPPVVTLALILINVAIFFGYQNQDSRYWFQAVDYHIEQELVQLETPEYLDYLERRLRLSEDHRRDLPQQIKALAEEEEFSSLSQLILADRDFTAHLSANAQRFWQDDVYRNWLQHRAHLESNWLQHISSIRFGITPADVGLADLFVYQFLHGDFGHVLGNMIFLFLLGFAVEAVLGKFRYLLAYLSCGALSGLFYSLLESGSHIPLVGASGSISGLMGMYVAIYQLQKIRFFFWAGIYFNYFKAPALWLLPIWVGKEVFDYWRDPHSGVAYMAHAGGLLAGAGIVAVLRKQWLKEDVLHSAPEEEADSAFRKSYQAALEAVSRVDFSQAKRRFQQLSEAHPEKIGMLEHLYHLLKLEPDTAEFLECTDKLLAAALKANQLDLAIAVYRDALKRTQPTQGEITGCAASVGLAESWHYRMLLACLKHNAMKEAEAAFQTLREVSSNLDIVRDGCQALVTAYRQREMPAKIQYYKTLAEQIDDAQLR